MSNSIESEKALKFDSLKAMSSTSQPSVKDIPFILEIFSNQNKSDKRALDFGCGGGRLIPQLKKYFRKVEGLDFSQEMLEKARKSNLDTIFFSNLDQLKHNYDLIVCFLVFMECESTNKIAEILSKLSTKLNQEGRIFICVNNDSMYQKNWPHLTTIFEENSILRKSNQVKVRLENIGVELIDYFYTEKDYEGAFAKARLNIDFKHYPSLNVERTIVNSNDQSLPYVYYSLKKPL